jgi:MOSC domain-containing protein
MTVLAIWRYPIKAMLGERLDAVAIGPGGCEGDRGFAVVDVASGRRIANKRGPTDPRLRACRACLADGELRVTLPDGAVAAGGEVADALSGLLERRVRLERGSGAGRGAFRFTGAHHDLAPVHLITTGTLAALREFAPGHDWDVRRFRPNLLLDGAGDDTLLGAGLRAPSGCELTVGLPTPRCVVPTRALDELPADPSLLREIVRRRRVDLGPAGRQGCAGSYAEVARGGRVAVGSRLEVRAGGVPPDAVIRSSLARIFGV